LAFCTASTSVGLPPCRTARTHRDLDVLDQLREQLAPLGVNDSLLVLRGGPFGVTRHRFTTLRFRLTAPVTPDFTARARAPGCVADDLYEQLVHAHVAGDLRVERGRKQAALPHRNDPTGGGTCGHRTEHLGALADVLDPWRADEHGMHRLPADPGDREVGLERVDLAAEGVAPHRDVQAAQRALALDATDQAIGEHDHPGARP